MSSLADITAALAARLEAERTKRVLTQAEAAAEIGCSVRSYQDYEAGRALPRQGMRRRIDEWLAAQEAAA